MRNNSLVRIGIVNPLTLVGNEVKTVLYERGIPFGEIELFDSTGLNENLLTELNDSAAVVVPLADDSLGGLDIVFFCGPRDSNAQWIARADRDGFTAIDLSQPAAVEAEGVAVVIGVNDSVLESGASIVVSPHPIAVALSLLVNALGSELAPRLCAASVVQPASEFDKEGVDELYEQTIRTLNLKSIPTKVFERQLAFNMYPAPNSRATERYVVEQVHATVGRGVPLTVNITQGTLFHGHTLSVFLQLPPGTKQEQVERALAANTAFAVADEEGFSTVDAAGKDQVLVGRISGDDQIDGGFWIWMVVDNLRRTSALNAVLAAETLLTRFGPPAN